MYRVETRQRAVGGNDNIERLMERNPEKPKSDRELKVVRATNLHSSITHNASRLFWPPTETTIRTLRFILHIHLNSPTLTRLRTVYLQQQRAINAKIVSTFNLTM